jgi:hypothetical protein
VSSGAIPNLVANEAHLSIVIDYTTSAYQVAGIRPELRYWQQRMTARTATAPQLGMFLRKLIESLEKIPDYAPEQVAQIVEADMPEDDPTVRWKDPKPMHWGSIPISRYSMDAARAVNYYFTLTPIKVPLIPDADLQFLHVAKIIEVALGLHHALKALPVLRAVEPQMRQGHLTEMEIRKCLRNTGVCLEQMPHYECFEDELKMLV